MTASPIPDLATITERLVTVEKEVAELKRRVRQPAEQPWYLKHAGKFAGDPEFQENRASGKGNPRSRPAGVSSESERDRGNVLVGYGPCCHSTNASTGRI